MPFHLALIYRLRLCLWLGAGLMATWANASSADLVPATDPRNPEAWWHERFLEKQVELHKHPVRLIFLGDSIFHSFEWDPRAPVWSRWYGGRGAINLGFNGDRTGDVIWRVLHGELDQLAPELAVILIGTNELGNPASDIVEAISDLARTIKEQSASTKILILGILPSGRPENEQRAAREVNARLSTLYSLGGAIASYRDVSCVFFRQGRFNAELFRESVVPGQTYPLHPTEQGLDLLAASIEPSVAAALGEHRRTSSGGMYATDCPAGG
jgi:lysophospholipase L1-like esterase